MQNVKMLEEQKKQRQEAEKKEVEDSMLKTRSLLTENKLPLEDMKRRVKRNLEKLEEHGVVSSKDDYQAIVNMIARVSCQLWYRARVTEQRCVRCIFPNAFQVQACWVYEVVKIMHQMLFCCRLKISGNTMQWAYSKDFLTPPIRVKLEEFFVITTRNICVSLLRVTLDLRSASDGNITIAISKTSLYLNSS